MSVMTWQIQIVSLENDVNEWMTEWEWVMTHSCPSWLIVMTLTERRTLNYWTSLNLLFSFWVLLLSSVICLRLSVSESSRSECDRARRTAHCDKSHDKTVYYYNWLWVCEVWAQSSHHWHEIHILRYCMCNIYGDIYMYDYAYTRPVSK